MDDITNPAYGFMGVPTLSDGPCFLCVLQDCTGYVVLNELIVCRNNDQDNVISCTTQQNEIFCIESAVLGNEE